VTSTGGHASVVNSLSGYVTIRLDTNFPAPPHRACAGLLAAFGALAMLPALIFILPVQKHRVRGPSFGALKDG
jgi:ABC-type glycerol-3-phosphate transport system permease component